MGVMGQTASWAALFCLLGRVSSETGRCAGEECADDDSPSLLSHRGKVSPLLTKFEAEHPLHEQLVKCLTTKMVKTGASGGYRPTPFALAEVLSTYVNGSLIDPDNLWRLHNRVQQYYVKPNAVVFPSNEGQVMQAVLCAMLADTPVVAQSGRHGYTAYCREGCLLVGTYRMKQVDINLKRRTGILGAGLNLGQAYTYLADKGFTIPGGTCPSVGLAGLTLGGGKGILARKYGLLIDRLAGIEAVLGNGTFVIANKDQHTDLYWLARGGGGNTFPGVVTAFNFNLVKAPRVVTEWTGTWIIPRHDLPEIEHPSGEEVFKAWQDKLLVHPDRRVYARLEIHPYGNPDRPDPTITMIVKFIDMQKDEALPYLQDVFRAIGEPKDGSWTVRSYWQSMTMGGGIGQTGEPGCKQWKDNMTWADAREEMLRAKPPFCAWDSGFDMSLKYRALVIRTQKQNQPRNNATNTKT
jgi:hypothetical protein